MNKSTRITVIAVAILATIALAWQISRWVRPTASSLGYDKYTLARGDLSLTVVGNGKIVSGDVKTVVPIGALSEVSVRVGDPVKKGDLLAKYMDALGKKRDFVSDYDGVITAIPSSGGLLSIGKATTTNFEISSKSSLQMDVQITEKEIYKIKSGQQAGVYIEALNKTIDGRVSRVSYAGNTEKDYTIYRVTVSLDGDLGDIFLGMTGSAKITVESKKNVYKVPVDAIIEEGSQRYLLKSDWLNHKNKPKKDYYAEVTTGLSDIDFIELTSGGLDDLEVVILPADDSTGFPRMIRQ